MNEQAQHYYQEIKEGNYWQDRDDIIEFLYSYQLDKGADFEIITSDELDQKLTWEAYNEAYDFYYEREILD